MSPQDIDQIKKQTEFQRLITAAHVHRRRGDYDQAEQLIGQALELYPDDLDAREFSADMLFAKGKTEDAAREYKALFEQDPSRTSAEEKFAKATIQIAEAKRQQELLHMMLENPSKFRAPSRSPLIAAILSLAPGFGQIYCGQFAKGAWIFVGSMISWMLTYAFAPPIAANLPVQDRVADFLKNLSPMAVLFVCIAVFLQVYAFVDAPVYASKTAENNAKKLTEPE